MRVVRVLGKLEPGGAQLALLRVMRALEQRHGVVAELWVGNASDEPGFWESLGYHNYGDPWREQRYDGD